MDWIDCSECHTRVTLAPHNTTIFTPSALTLNGAWLDVICKCQEHTTTDLEPAAVAKLAAAGYSIAIPLAPKTIGGTLASEVDAFAALLDALDTEQIMMVFESPPPKSWRPNRWD